ETLMCDIYLSTILQNEFRRRHQKTSPLAPERLECNQSMFWRCFGHSAELSECRGSANLTAVNITLPQTLKNPFDNLLSPRQLLTDLQASFVGMAGQGFRHSSDRLVVRNVHNPRSLPLVSPMIPSPHEPMLHHRKLARIFTRIVQDSLHKAR